MAALRTSTVCLGRPLLPRTRIVRPGLGCGAKTTRTAHLRPLRVSERPPPPEEEERVYDEDGLYIGTYSNFFSDPAQIKGVVVFSAVLAAFFSLGNVGAAIVLPLLYNKPIELCVQAVVLGYPCS